MEKPGEGDRSNEAEHQQRMQPPDTQVRDAHRMVGQSGEAGGKNPQPDRRTFRADADGMLPANAQGLDQVTGYSDGDEGPQHIPTGGAVANPRRTPRPPP